MENKYTISISDFSDYRKNGIIYVNKNIVDKDMSMTLYRYINWEYLIEMLDSGSLYVSNRQRFSDLREQGRKEDMKKFFPLSPILDDEESNKRFSSESYRRWWASYHTCVSCWTSDEYDYENSSSSNENYLMWKSYSNGIMCRIETIMGVLLDNITKNNADLKYDILFSKVSYLEKERFADNDPQHYIFEKPIYYRDEQEYRLAVLSTNDCVHLKIDPYIIIKNITISPFVNPKMADKIIDFLKKGFPKLNGITIQRSHVMEYK